MLATKRRLKMLKRREETRSVRLKILEHKKKLKSQMKPVDFLNLPKESKHDRMESRQNGNGKSE